MFPVLGGGDLFSGSSIATSTNVAIVAGPHGFSRVLSSSESVVHEPAAVVPQGFLVPHGRQSCFSSPSVTGVHGICLLVAPGGQVGFRCSTSGSSSVPASAY